MTSLPTLPSLAVNEDEIKQILLNLFNNSSDALEAVAGSKQISIRAYRSGSRAVIEVEDSGPGFGNLNRALDPFYTTKPVGKGTGLGLSVCYGIVKERGGDLRIENVQPHGARVTIELPGADASGAAIHGCRGPRLRAGACTFACPPSSPAKVMILLYSRPAP